MLDYNRADMLYIAFGFAVIGIALIAIVEILEQMADEQASLRRLYRDTISRREPPQGIVFDPLAPDKPI